MVCIDLDDPMRTLEDKADFRAMTPARQAEVLAYCHDIMKTIERWAEHYGAWAETSMSGRGTHIFMRGRLPDPRYAIGFGGSIYSSRQYIAITGHLKPYSGRDVPYNTAALLELIGWLKRIDVIRAVQNQPQGETTIEPSEGLGRRLDLTDDQVVAILPKINKLSLAWMMGRPGKHGDWSKDCFALIGDLDKISGSPEQVKRILLASPRLQNPGPGGNGKRDRRERTIALFDRELAKCRGSNARELAMRAKRAAEAEALWQAFKGRATGGQDG